VRSSAFGFRFSVTVLFSVFGVTSLRCDFIEVAGVSELHVEKRHSLVDVDSDRIRAT
jgi:hypothetical protein